jgi:hypothetical protein
MANEEQVQKYFDPEAYDAPTSYELLDRGDYLVHIVPEIKFSENPINEGTPYVNMALVIDEPDEFAGRYAAWDMIMLNHLDVEKVRGVRGRAHETIAAILGEDFWATGILGNDPTEDIEALSEALDGLVTVVSIKVQKARKDKNTGRTFDAKNVVASSRDNPAYKSAEDWGSADDLPF